jgi:hypothetical protein
MRDISQARRRKQVSKKRKREIEKQRQMKEAFKYTHEGIDIVPINFKITDGIVDDGTIDCSENVPEPVSRCIIM